MTTTLPVSFDCVAYDLELLKQKHSQITQSNYTDQYGIPNDFKALTLAQIQADYKDCVILVFDCSIIQYLFSSGKYYPLDLYCPLEICLAYITLDEGGLDIWEFLSTAVDESNAALNPASFGQANVPNIEETIKRIETALDLLTKDVNTFYLDQYKDSLSPRQAVVYADITNDNKFVVVIEELKAIP